MNQREGYARLVTAQEKMRVKFTLIQALRGIAALWVVLFHLEQEQTINGLIDRLPSGLTYSLFEYGSAGVAVFFVLSGFVIAHSLANKTMDAREFGRFAVRRSIRLDPPYWASMVLVIVVSTIIAKAHNQPPAYPSAGQLGAHVLYIQELLNVPEIQIVYWTLTYEIQFYLVFAGSVWFGWKRAWMPLYALALISALKGGSWAPHGLFANLWHAFFMGVLAYRAGYLRNHASPLLVLAIATIWGRDQTSIFAVPVVGASLLLFSAARLGKLTMLRGTAWQWLGAISYSLYLVHLPALRLLTGPWQHIAGRSFIADTLALFALVGFCLIAAAMMHFLVEGPCHRIATRLFRGSAEAVLHREAAFRSVATSRSAASNGP